MHIKDFYVRDITLSSQNVLRGDDLEGPRPPQRGEISHFSMQLMMEFLSYEPFSNFMEIYGPSMRFEISHMMITMNCTYLSKKSLRTTGIYQSTASKTLRNQIWQMMIQTLLFHVLKDKVGLILSTRV